MHVTNMKLFSTSIGHKSLVPELIKELAERVCSLTRIEPVCMMVFLAGYLERVSHSLTLSLGVHVLRVLPCSQGRDDIIVICGGVYPFSLPACRTADDNDDDIITAYASSLLAFVVATLFNQPAGPVRSVRCALLKFCNMWSSLAYEHVYIYIYIYRCNSATRLRLFVRRWCHEHFRARCVFTRSRCVLFVAYVGLCEPV